ncbi:MAG: hypothetical protein KGL44_02325 [Sphingomonadales bacterium]|nr:hypothetical protein [Sphingomonadales bacterium]
MREQHEQSASMGLSRRQFAAMGGAAALASYAGGVQAADLPVRETPVRIDGTDAMLFQPAEGQHPGVVLWPDRGGLRSANAGIARSLAAQGLAVLLVRDGQLQHDDLAIHRTTRKLTNWLVGQDAVQSGEAGYALRAVGPMVSPLTARGIGAGVAGSYLVATPLGITLSSRQRGAIAAAVDATHRLARATA